MKNVYPLLLKPHLEHPIWSGTKLVKEWGVVSEKSVGEGFFMSTLPDKESIIVNGVYKDKPLSYALADNPDFTLDNSSSLDLLFKIIDTSDMLSVQVHPDDNYATSREGQLGKTESWLILHAEGDSYIYMGLKDDCDKKMIENAIKNNTVENLLNKIYVKEGDYFYINSGTIHALGKNITVAEIQQSSMVTYRLYDYDRRDKLGNPRELHIDKSLDVINYNKTSIEDLKHNTHANKNTLNLILKEKYFSTYNAFIDNNLALRFNYYSLIMVIVGY